MENKSDNGILARIQGQYVGAALNSLPAPELSTEDAKEVEIVVSGIGRVRITARLLKSKHGKFISYFWSATRATLVE